MMDWSELYSIVYVDVVGVIVQEYAVPCDEEIVLPQDTAPVVPPKLTMWD